MNEQLQKKLIIDIAKSIATMVGVQATIKTTDTEIADDLQTQIDSLVEELRVLIRGER